MAKVFEFSPPSRDPGVDIVQHIWATKNAITSWESVTPMFVEVLISEAVEDLLRFHPRLTHQSIAPATLDSIWGIPIRVDRSLSDDPGYEISYMRRD